MYNNAINSLKYKALLEIGDACGLKKSISMSPHIVWHHDFQRDINIINTTMVCNNLEEEVKDTKGVIRIHKSRKDKQHNGQKKKDKKTNNDLQNITH